MSLVRLKISLPNNMKLRIASQLHDIDPSVFNYTLLDFEIVLELYFFRGPKILVQS